MVRNLSSENSFRSLPFSRRALLQSGMAGVLGATLPEILSVEAQAADGGKKRTAKNVLVVLEQGGMSHTDTWDPKPEVTAEHRSPYKPVSTNVPGIQFTSLLSKTAQVADKLAVVRSMYHKKAGANGHPKGTQYALSGEHPSSPLEMPDMGSIISKLMGTDCAYLPPYIMVPGNSEQAKESRLGFLPAAYQVFKTGGRNIAEPDWKVKDLLPREENGDGRLLSRQRLLSELESPYLKKGDKVRNLSGMKSIYEQAFDTLTSGKVQQAFDHHSEPANVRERYGAGHRGSCYLVGRKLIEAGVRFVTVDVRWPRTNEHPMGTNLNWDHHDYIYTDGTCNLPGASGAGRGRRGIGTWEMMGSTDQAFAALISDLDERGLLDETLVCFVTEFGRTPRVNKYHGRDHWVQAYSIAFAGAGIQGGQVIGSTDKDGGYVTSQPHTPDDYAATIYEILGINRTSPIITPANRPVFLAHDGKPISEVML